MTPASHTTPAILDATRSGDECTVQLCVPTDLACFPGHFPQAPVLPGAMQVAWALRLSAEHLGTAADCHEMEALKFQRLLRPGDSATLHLRFDRASGKLHFVYRHGDTTYSSGRLVLGGCG